MTVYSHSCELLDWALSESRRCRWIWHLVRICPGAGTCTAKKWHTTTQFDSETGAINGFTHPPEPHHYTPATATSSYDGSTRTIWCDTHTDSTHFHHPPARAHLLHTHSYHPSLLAHSISAQVGVAPKPTTIGCTGSTGSLLLAAAQPPWTFGSTWPAQITTTSRRMFQCLLSCRKNFEWALPECAGERACLAHVTGRGGPRAPISRASQHARPGLKRSCIGSQMGGWIGWDGWAAWLQQSQVANEKRGTWSVGANRSPWHHWAIGRASSSHRQSVRHHCGANKQPFTTWVGSTKY